MKEIGEGNHSKVAHDPAVAALWSLPQGQWGRPIGRSHCTYGSGMLAASTGPLGVDYWPHPLDLWGQTVGRTH